MKNSILLCLTVILTLSSCRKGSIPEEQQDKCEPDAILKLRAAETNFKIFKTSGIEYGQNLTTSHRLFKELKENYSYFSCEGVDTETGEIVWANMEYITKYEQEAYSLLISNRSLCRKKAPITNYERLGCSYIELYLKNDLNI